MIDRNFALHLRNGSHLKDLAQRELVKAMRSGRMIAFVGSFASEDLGQPGWSEFLESAIPTAKLKDVKRLQETAHTLREEIVRSGKGAPSSDDVTLYFDLLREILSVENKEGPEQARKKRREWSDKVIAKQFDLKPVADWNGKAIKALLDELGIRRVITTNYDLEFEWHWLLKPSEKIKPHRAKTLLEIINRPFPKGLRPSSDHKKDSDYRLERSFPDGGYAVSDCFHRDRPDRLFEFSIASPDNDRHILHLHGRASDPETLIVSYSEYERQYRQSHISQLPFQHGLRTLFAGNPILFVGLGLNERELTATLEQFVSDNKPGHVAPAFVIWSPDAENLKARKKDKTEPWDEIKRLKFFRKYGVLTLFDTELPTFSESADRPGRSIPKQFRLAKSVSLLAKHTRGKIPGFGWKREHFRDMQGFLNSATKPGLSTTGTHVWGVVRAGEAFDPEFEPLDAGFNWKTANRESTKGPAFLDDSRYLLHLFERTPPIKAFLDQPGAGHGYLTKVLGDVICGALRIRDNARPDAIKDRIIYCQINAGFSWEIDTTFSLISGLYDNKTAFRESRSRGAAIDKFTEDVRVEAEAKKRSSRVIFLSFNGVDRYFDASGYPLSHELDLLIRQLHLLHNPPDAWKRGSSAAAVFANYSAWREGKNDLHPFNLLLFGTRRVARYLSALESTTVDKSNFGEDGLYRTGMVKGAARDQQNSGNKVYSIFGRLPESQESGEPGGKGLADRIYKRWEKADPKLRGPLPIMHPGRKLAKTDAPASIHLRDLKQAFDDKLKKRGTKLSVAAETRLAMARMRRVGEQRRAYFEALLDPEVLAAVLRGTATKKARSAELCLTLLRTMAFVGQPVEIVTLARIGAIKAFFNTRMTAQDIAKKLTTFLDELLDLKLVIEIERFPGLDERYRRIGLHRALLHEMRDRNTVPISDARTYASFNIPLFAAQPVDDHEPEIEAYDQLEELIDDLIDIGNLAEKLPERLADNTYGLGLRAAAASMRSYYTTSSLLMQDAEEDDPAKPRLADHVGRIEDLIRAAEASADAQLKEKTPVKNFFPDDLVWLHDQRGVALLAQGDLYEARHAMQQAEAINTRFVEFRDHHQNWRRIQLNLLHLDIERGKISKALNRISKIEQSVDAQAHKLRWRQMQPGLDRLDLYPTAGDAILDRYAREPRLRIREVDPVFPADLVLCTGLVTGYRGWCEYLLGRFRTSESYFTQSIQLLRNLGEQRAYATFMRLYASLQLALRDNDGARETLELCIAAADSSRQMDIAHMARITMVQFKLMGADTEAEQTGGLRQLLKTLDYADRTNMYRVRMEARRALAQLRLSQGDYDGALEQAADSLSVATRFGFSLRKVSLRVLIGKILIRRGDKISGRALIDQALRIADRLGYQRVVEEAQKVRMETD